MHETFKELINAHIRIFSWQYLAEMIDVLAEEQQRLLDSDAEKGDVWIK